jgi:hypothetical protein
MTYMYSGMIFILMLMQPGIVSHLISVLSCRNIGGIKYIMADMTKECYSL